MLESVPKGVKALVAIIIIAVTGFVVYRQIRYNFGGINSGRWQKRLQQKAEWERKQAYAYTEPLRKKGRQRAGAYEIKGTYQKDLDYTDVVITKKKDGKVVTEIKAPRMTVVMANQDVYRVRVFDATVTTYDEEGNPTTERLPKALVILHELRLGGGPGDPKRKGDIIPEE